MPSGPRAVSQAPRVSVRAGMMSRAQSQQGSGSAQSGGRPDVAEGEVIDAEPVETHDGR